MDTKLYPNRVIFIPVGGSPGGAAAKASLNKYRNATNLGKEKDCNFGSNRI